MRYGRCARSVNDFAAMSSVQIVRPVATAACGEDSIISHPAAVCALAADEAVAAEAASVAIPAAEPADEIVARSAREPVRPRPARAGAPGLLRDSVGDEPEVPERHEQPPLSGTKAFASATKAIERPSAGST